MSKHLEKEFPGTSMNKQNKLISATKKIIIGKDFINTVKDKVHSHRSSHRPSNERFDSSKISNILEALKQKKSRKHPKTTSRGKMPSELTDLRPKDSFDRMIQKVLKSK